MIEESLSPLEENDPANAEVVAEPQPPPAPETSPTPSGPETEAAESRTRGMLREAIQKVMDEIAHHEREAEKHLQQAAELRKDLRESFAFLRERGKSEKPPETVAPRPSLTVEAEPQEPAATPPAPSRRRRGRKKKKSAAGKGKGGTSPR
jgi:hypothetical protein